MDSDTLKVSLNNGIAQIEINRPEKKNALTQAMYVAMADALAQADNNPAVRVVLINGQSNVFTSGNDLQDFMKFKSDEPFESGAIFRFLRGISAAAKPVIAAVNGAAIGIGTTMLLHCDLVYAGESASEVCSGLLSRLADERTAKFGLVQAATACASCAADALRCARVEFLPAGEGCAGGS